MRTPTISVVMPVYNAGPFLKEAIQSILDQTYKDFELIIINDGSTDDSLQIIREFEKQDKRLRSLNQSNHGLVYSLNKGIKTSKGKYLARMDADDLSYPGRLESQLKIIRSSMGVIIVGCTYESIDEENNKLGVTVVSTEDNEIKRELFCRCPFAHGSVLISKEALQKVNGYRQLVPVEDYDLWIRLARLGKFANTAEILFAYRVTNNSISRSNEDKQRKETKKLISKLWKSSQPDLIVCKDIVSKYKELLSDESMQARLFYDNQIRIMNLAEDFSKDDLYKEQKCAINKMRLFKFLSTLTR